ncbi:MAG TPA: hypothetical protein VKA70_16590 [Blastocatellia bacterium]|nr:hypothetical protein [Blastocatellia bacterium]
MVRRLLISKDEAIELYEKRRLSINAIATSRGVHPELIRRDLIYLGFTTRSQKQPPNYFSYDPRGLETLEAAAIGIWMGEGTKRGKRVEVTNCDPVILRVWLSFLKKVCHVESRKLRLRIALHDAELKDAAKQYWQEALGLSIPCAFSIKKLKAGAPVKQPMGTASLRFNSIFLLEHIQHRAVGLAASLM